MENIENNDALKIKNDSEEDKLLDVNKKNSGYTRKRRKEKIGIVTSSKMNKSIVVLIERREQHPIYKKYFKKGTKIMVHDSGNQAKQGDIVRITEFRKISKRKSWVLATILEKAK